MKRIQAVILLLVTAFPSRISRNGHSFARSECVESGLTPGGEEMYMAVCHPTNCHVTKSNRLQAEDLECTITNYKDRGPDACRKMKESLQQKLKQLPDDSCQASLTSISLYNFYCSVIDVTEVSLNFTYELPNCDVQLSSDSAVMVNFNAKNESIHNYFKMNPNCRVFSYRGNQMTTQDEVQISYDCMGIGLQDSYPQVYYYLSLTSYPSGALLNYTIVFKDVGAGSMRIVAAAWLSTSRVHVVFEPIDGVTMYNIQARGNDFIYSNKVSSTAVEIMGIPSQANIITVDVIPAEWQEGKCASREMPCFPISVTLHDRTQIGLTVEPSADVDRKRSWVAWAVPLLSTACICVLLIVTVRVIRQIKQAGSGTQLSVLTITSGSIAAQHLLRKLQKLGLHWKDALILNRSEGTITLLSENDIVLFIVHPVLNLSPNWEAVITLLQTIFKNQPLMDKVVVASVDHEGPGRCMPSEIFFDEFNNDLGRKFLAALDKVTFKVPKDMKALQKTLQDQKDQKALNRVKKTSDVVSYIPTEDDSNEDSFSFISEVLDYQQHVDRRPVQIQRVHVAYREPGLHHSGPGAAQIPRIPAVCREHHQHPARPESQCVVDIHRHQEPESFSGGSHFLCEDGREYQSEIFTEQSHLLSDHSEDEAVGRNRLPPDGCEDRNEFEQMSETMDEDDDWQRFQRLNETERKTVVPALDRSCGRNLSSTASVSSTCAGQIKRDHSSCCTHEGNLLENPTSVAGFRETGEPEDQTLAPSEAELQGSISGSTWNSVGMHHSNVWRRNSTKLEGEQHKEGGFLNSSGVGLHGEMTTQNGLNILVHHNKKATACEAEEETTGPQESHKLSVQQSHSRSSNKPLLISGTCGWGHREVTENSFHSGEFNSITIRPEDLADPAGHDHQADHPRHDHHDHCPRITDHRSFSHYCPNEMLSDLAADEDNNSMAAFIPKGPPEWSQRWQLGHKRDSLLARDGSRVSTQPQHSPDISCPWFTRDHAEVPQQEEVDRLAEELFRGQRGYDSTSRYHGQNLHGQRDNTMPDLMDCQRYYQSLSGTRNYETADFGHGSRTNNTGNCAAGTPTGSREEPGDSHSNIHRAGYGASGGTAGTDSDAEHSQDLSRRNDADHGQQRSHRNHHMDLQGTEVNGRGSVSSVEGAENWLYDLECGCSEQQDRGGCGMGHTEPGSEPHSPTLGLGAQNKKASSMKHGISLQVGTERAQSRNDQHNCLPIHPGPNPPQRQLNENFDWEIRCRVREPVEHGESSEEDNLDSGFEKADSEEDSLPLE